MDDYSDTFQESHDIIDEVGSVMPDTPPKHLNQPIRYMKQYQNDYLSDHDDPEPE